MRTPGDTIGGRMWIAVIALLVGACSSSGGTRTAPSTTTAAPIEYRIGPGDALNIFVWNHPELSGNVPVRPDGLISTPLVENIPASGKTPSELSREIETRLSEYVRSPKVNVIVTTFVGALADQIRVVGQATKPQSLPYRANLTVLDVMIQVGGLAEYAAGNRARLIRTVDGKVVEIPVRLNDLLNRGDIKANIPVLPGDVLMIPESRF